MLNGAPLLDYRARATQFMPSRDGLVREIQQLHRNGLSVRDICSTTYLDANVVIEALLSTPTGISPG